MKTKSKVAEKPIEYLRANGGQYWHLVPEGENKALCGYEPSSPKRSGVRQMVARGRWMNKAPEAPASGKCEKCLVKQLRARPKDQPICRPQPGSEEESTTRILIVGDRGPVECILTDDQLTGAERKAENAMRIFKGCDTDQMDHGKPADSKKWYFEPLYHDGPDLWSAGYDSAEEAGAAIGELYDETEDVE